MRRGMGTLWGLVVGGSALILLMFVFERQVDSALQLVGYNDNFVSYFPFIGNIYFRLVSSHKLASVDVAYFHLLDVAVCLTVAVWGIWLMLGVIFLNRHGAAVRVGLSYALEGYRGRRPLIYFTWIFMLSTPIIMSIPPRLPLDNPELLFVLRHIPGFYFFGIALTYYICGGFVLGLSLLLLIWKTFYQNRPHTEPENTRATREARS
jgi:hypothetical protein